MDTPRCDDLLARSSATQLRKTWEVFPICHDDVSYAYFWSYLGKQLLIKRGGEGRPISDMQPLHYCVAMTLKELP